MDSFHSNQLLAPPLCDVTVPVKTQMQMCSVQSTVCIWLQPVKIEPNSVVSAQMEMTVLKSSLITADPPIKTQLHTPIYSYNTTALIGLLGYRSRFYKGLFTFSQVYLHLVLSWFFYFIIFLNKWKILKDVCHTDIILAMDLLPHWIIHTTVQLEHSPWDLGGNKETSGSSSALWNFLTLLPSAVVNAITWQVKGHWFQRSQSRRASGQFWTLQRYMLWKNGVLTACGCRPGPDIALHSLEKASIILIMFLQH